MTKAKDGRLAARLTGDVKQLIEHGAALRGLSVSDFLVQSAAQAARDAIREQQVVTLTLEGKLAFARALQQPPEPNSALQQAKARHAALLSES